jgi:surface antigen
MMRIRSFAKPLALVVAGAVGISALTGCETKAGTGALVGGAAGAGVGAIIGHNSHGRTGSGALIGGAVGAIGGALVGNEMDKADRKREQEARYDRDYRDAPPPASSARVTKNDVIAWSGRGMSDPEIMDRIDRSGTVFHLTAADEMQLRDARVSEDVIREMKDTARH